jgi:hypothetical protein
MSSSYGPPCSKAALNIVLADQNVGARFTQFYWQGCLVFPAKALFHQSECLLPFLFVSISDLDSFGPILN